MTLLIKYDEINEALKEIEGTNSIKLVRVFGKEYQYALIFKDSASLEKYAERAIEIVNTVQSLKFDFSNIQR